jgi:hypothetical protein
MNQLLSNIYETAGFEKTASAETGLPENLSDLALMVAVEDAGEDSKDVEKIASVHGAVMDQFVSFDRAGRAIAHQEFGEMEKEASEGNTAPIEAFFADILRNDEEPAAAEEEEADLTSPEISQMKEAILHELAKRQQ